MRQQRKADLQHGLSWLLVAYLAMLLSILLGIHALQPTGGGAGTSSRSPAHQERQTTTKQTANAVAWQTAGWLLRLGEGRPISA
jgi:hypothetical protein